MVSKYGLVFAVGCLKHRFWAKFLARFLDRANVAHKAMLTGFGPHPRGPKSGQGKVANLDALTVIPPMLTHKQYCTEHSYLRLRNFGKLFIKQNQEVRKLPYQ